ncbi:glycoside hydrolase family 15 protein [Bradyrhizobium sp. U87765 SZCCT0131]|uniref:glycoside hydrolase family 15 protein n=1 Tax=Bradyrhizobium sp. U87765 SZCCT0109 TaxID=2807656 RepID=UPI001BA61173|nr:glycoside hydrolase family 15 protein [Bradyrhizobium sp. U87765 SZCCT0131]MBR1260736.1 glycoside hydrolase family 15 protein [Bradyrhizobium sp. U87765 SZCCT0134]MBR1303816.1 glycoside hydrolase family 15 protein [Bradyrhizobium sp. U87765 SZCCT0110]MBR1319422.1 glycoside hydrolase family 15 protein [Bradyrhizobium sp. U87765 SZCCT0109]MBR1347747.1 glycoside hydrolase family 15 protein [Bradyrhizobium sp. U87765 SZCCT0048]
MPSRIEDYALIGDCLTAALVGRDGSIDWLCWPAFDSEACFAALLGTPDHGRWLIAPQRSGSTVTRAYRRETLILETRFTCDTGVVTLVDFMPPRGEASDIVRIVRGDSGRVAMSMELVLRFGTGANIPWVRRLDDGTLLAVAGPDMVVLRTPVDVRGENMTTVATFDVEAGDVVPFVLTYQASHRPVPASVDPLQAMADTEAFWTEWSSRSTYHGKRRELVQRSLITLKALTFAPTGGIVAAPTASLPEKIGGARNWDYRYCWLRDATFTLFSLMNSGYYAEAGEWHNWLLRSVAGSPADLQIMYSITGQRRLLEWEAGWLPGYEGSQPVRFGNAAHAQLQLDVYGELLDTFHHARKAEVELDGGTWALECAILDHVAEVWMQPDSGIWEVRGAGRHYVFSKVMCWVAFDRGIKSAEAFGFDAPVDLWKQLRERIHADICTNGIDPDTGGFVVAYGGNTLDASLLLLPSVGFLPVGDPRIAATIAGIERHLMRDGFVLRHDPREPRPDEVEPIEGAFLACTLWLADSYVMRGDIEKARELFLRVAGVANDVGLISEEYDPVSRRQTGNFPQALTHIALINTAHNIYEAVHSSRKPVVQRPG